jgi:hypothetical protein
LLINDNFDGFNHHSNLPPSRQERISKKRRGPRHQPRLAHEVHRHPPRRHRAIVYANARTQPLLEVIRTTDGGVTKQQGTYTRYNARGQAIWQVSPEAIDKRKRNGKGQA